MMEKRTGLDEGAFEKGLQQDACHGEIYDVLASGRECGKVGRCRKGADAMFHGEFCAQSNAVEVQSLGK